MAGFSSHIDDLTGYVPSLVSHIPAPVEVLLLLTIARAGALLLPKVGIGSAFPRVGIASNLESSSQGNFFFSGYAYETTGCRGYDTTG
jgi:hypothetical protein